MKSPTAKKKNRSGEEETAMEEETTTDSNLQVVVYTEDKTKTNPDEAQASNPKKKDKIQWVYKRPEMRDVKCKINFHCRESIMKIIQKVLKSKGKEAVLTFKKSCLGHFLNLPETINKCGSAVHYVISREIIVGEKTDEVNFCINDKRLQFTRFEYALITGLRFGDLNFNKEGDAIIKGDSLFTRRFDNITMSIEQLKDLFEEGKITEHTSDYIKVAKILLLYYFVLGMQPKKTIVEKWIWAMVERDEDWENFPWGSYSYQHLLHYIKSIKTTPSRRAVDGKDKVEAIHIFGCSTAFLAWIYCVIPELGKACGHVRSKTARPRIFRFNYYRTNMMVTEVTGMLHERMIPDSEESETEYWLSIEPEHKPLSLNYAKDKYNVVQIEEGNSQLTQKSVKFYTPKSTPAENEEDEEETEEQHETQEEQSERETQVDEDIDTETEQQTQTEKETEQETQTKKTQGNICKKVEKKRTEATIESETGEDSQVGKSQGNREKKAEQKRKKGRVESQTEQDIEIEKSQGNRGKKVEKKITEATTESGITPDQIEEIAKKIHQSVTGDVEFIKAIAHSTTTYMLTQSVLSEEIAEYVGKHIAQMLQETQAAAITKQKEKETQENTEMDIDLETTQEPRHSPCKTPTDDRSLFDLGDIADDDPFWSQAGKVADAEARAHAEYADQQWKRARIDGGYGDYPEKLDFITVRARAASAALCSPFRPYDRRGANFDKFLKTTKDRRNIGSPLAVTSAFFKYIADPKKELENMHIDAYLAVLYTSPEMAGIRSFKRRVTITSTSFMATIFRMWVKYNNEDETPESNTQNDIKIETEDLFELSQFVVGEQPAWGHIKPWHDYDKVIAVVHILHHWNTICINIKESCITIYDSQQHKWAEDDYAISIQNMVPLARLLPHVLKYAGFYDARPDIEESMMQWKIEHPKDVNLYEQSDDVNCGPFALKFVEAILTGRWEDGFNAKSLKKYRTNIAMNIYGFSTAFDE